MELFLFSFWSSTIASYRLRALLSKATQTPSSHPIQFPLSCHYNYGTSYLLYPQTGCHWRQGIVYLADSQLWLHLAQMYSFSILSLVTHSTTMWQLGNHAHFLTYSLLLCCNYLPNCLDKFVLLWWHLYHDPNTIRDPAFIWDVTLYEVEIRAGQF